MTSLVEELKNEKILRSNYLEKKFEIQTNLLFVTWPCHINSQEDLLEYLKSKLKSHQSDLDIELYCNVNETSETGHQHCHAFLQLNFKPKNKIKDETIFDTEDNIHPHIIGSCLREGDNHGRIYKYLSKQGYPHTNFPERNIKIWRDEMVKQPKKKSIKSKNMSSAELKDLAKKIKESPEDYQSTCAYSQIESVLTTANRVKKVFPPLPENQVYSEKEKFILNTIKENKGKIIHIIYSEGDNFYSNLSNHLYDFYPGICPIELCNIKHLAKFINTYNRSTFDIKVETIFFRTHGKYLLKTKEYFDTIRKFMVNDLFYNDRHSFKKISQDTNPNVVVMTEESQLHGLEYWRDLKDYYEKSLFLFIDHKFQVDKKEYTIPLDLYSYKDLRNIWKKNSKIEDLLKVRKNPPIRILQKYFEKIAYYNIFT